MQNPSEHHKLTSENNRTKFKKPVHDPFKSNSVTDNWVLSHSFHSLVESKRLWAILLWQC